MWTNTKPFMIYMSWSVHEERMDYCGSASEYLNGIKHLHQLGQIVCQQCQRAFQFWLNVAWWYSTVLQRSPTGGDFSLTVVVKWSTVVGQNSQDPEKVRTTRTCVASFISCKIMGICRKLRDWCHLSGKSWIHQCLTILTCALRQHILLYLSLK